MSVPSARLSLPYLQAAQAQKEITHNTALAILDMLVQAVAQDASLSAPPTSPVDGSAYIVGAPATGDWAGQENQVALRINGAWQFQVPFDGLALWLEPSGQTIRYSDGGWRTGDVNASLLKIDGVQVLTSQQTAIADASGGATIDLEARAALNAILAALRSHGLIAT